MEPRIVALWSSLDFRLDLRLTTLFTFAQNVKGTGKRSLNFLSGTYRLIKKFKGVQEWRAAEVASEIYTQSEYTMLNLSICASNR